jgi:hypothetical protein
MLLRRFTRFSQFPASLGQSQGSLLAEPSAGGGWGETAG